MTDEIIRELWKIKEDIAREYNYDLDALIADLRSEKLAGRPRIADLHAIRATAEPSLSSVAENAGGVSRESPGRRD